MSAAGTRPATEPVRTANKPKLVPPARPLTLAPTRNGTSRPATSPIRREKKGISARLEPRPNSKMSDPSRKKARFSGKKRGKRVRFVCRTSTSVSAKSVLTVNDAIAPAPTSCVTSRLASPLLLQGAPLARKPEAPTTEGVTLRPSPRSKRGSPVSRPAWEVCVRL